MKLPEIITGTGTASQGRYGSRAPSIVQQTGKVKGQAIASAGRIVGQATTQAGIYEAQGKLSAEKYKIDVIKRDTIKREQLKIYADAAMSTALVRATTGLAQAGLSYMVKKNAIKQSSAVSREAANVENSLGEAAAYIKNNSVTNVDDFPFLEGQLEGKDVTTLQRDDGTTYQTVPTHQVRELILEGVHQQATANIGDGLDPEYADELKLKTDNAYMNAGLSTYASEQNQFKQYEMAKNMAAIDAAMDAGNIKGAIDIAAASEATGLAKPGFARGIEKEVLAVSQYKQYFAGIEAATSKGQLSDIQAKIVADNSIDEVRTNQLVARAEKRENEIAAESNGATYQSVTTKHIELNPDVAEMNENEILSDIKDDFVSSGMEPKAVKSAMISARAKLKEYKGAELRYKQNVLDDQVAELRSGNPNVVASPELTTKMQTEFDKYKDAFLDGREVETDRFEFNKWLRIAESENPADRKLFLAQDFRSQVGTYAQTEMDRLAKMQTGIREQTNEPDIIYGRTFNAAVTGKLTQYFGKPATPAKLSGDQFAEAENLRYIAQATLDDAIRANDGKKLDGSQQEALLNDLFTAKIKENKSAFWGGRKTVDTTLPESALDDNAFTVVAELRQLGIPVTAATYAQKANEMILDGRL